MIADKTYEQKLLQEIKGLNQNDVKKILRMIHFMKKEIFTTEKKTENINIMNYAGMLNDLTDEEVNVFATVLQRQKLFGGREVNL